MQLEEKLMETILEPQSWILFKESIASVLEKIGWPKAEVPEAVEIIRRRLNSSPVVQSGVSDR